jgi:DNA-binding CsgD family transcriptional regulator
LQVEQTDAIWQRLRAGMAAKPAARELGISTGTVRAYLVRCGGIQPALRRRRAGYLTLLEREEISRGLAAGLSFRKIADRLQRAVSTISREVNLNGGRLKYRALAADRAAWARTTRPKPCKLAMHSRLRDIVEDKLRGERVLARLQHGIC